MPTLFADLYDGEEDTDDELYEPEDFVIGTELDEVDPDKDEDEIYCRECGTEIEDGIQCPTCGLMVEVIQ
jgi:rubrerythrin